mmetsp:Transcript_84789/g.150129  ORF Transcript_84789/g.150129 Transcript_84789/m.150129 type:complete len:118 (+) Transcript_84789:137-490(+)
MHQQSRRTCLPAPLFRLAFVCVCWALADGHVHSNTEQWDHSQDTMENLKRMFPGTRIAVASGSHQEGHQHPYSRSPDTYQPKPAPSIEKKRQPEKVAQNAPPVDTINLQPPTREAEL